MCSFLSSMPSSRLSSDCMMFCMRGRHVIRPRVTGHTNPFAVAQWLEPRKMFFSPWRMFNAAAKRFIASTNLCMKSIFSGENQRKPNSSQTVCRRSLSYAGIAGQSASLVSALGVKVAMWDNHCIERNIEFHRVSFGATKLTPNFSSPKSDTFGLCLTHKQQETALDSVLYRLSLSVSLATRFKVWAMHFLWGGRQGSTKAERGAGSISSSSSELSLAVAVEVDPDSSQLLHRC